MTGALLTGLLAGLATIGISELVLKFGGPRPAASVWTLTVAGIALRTLWILSVLTAVLIQGGPHVGVFVPALLAGYLAAQIWEGFRYQRAMAAK